MRELDSVYVVGCLHVTSNDAKSPPTTPFNVLLGVHCNRVLPLSNLFPVFA
jgi:hypothetical protein